MDLISIIVPVYNVGQLLNECVGSLIKQTYDNLEIILVDDGSPDECPKICDEWAKRDERIKVIHKQNGGLPDARNAGLAIATGDYIAFVDCDDWVEKTYIEDLYKALKDTDSDISVCGIKMQWDDGKSMTLTGKGCFVLDNKQAFESIITEEKLNQVVWNKLYKREIIQGIDFSVGKFHEDVFWSYQVIAKAKKVAVIDELLYIYRQRTQSMMGSGLSLKSIDDIEAKVKRQSFVEKNYPDLTVIAKKSLLFHCIYYMQKLLRGEVKEKSEVNEIKGKLKKYYKENKFTSSEKKQLNKKERTIFNFADISLVATGRLRNFLKMGI